MNKMALARASRFLKRHNRPSKKCRQKVPRYRRVPWIGKQSMIKAIRSSGGIIAGIERELDVSYSCVKSHLECEGWDDVRQIYAQVVVDRMERGLDFAEDTIFFMMRQRMDYGKAFEASKWYLLQHGKKRGYSDTKKVEVEGGDKPIRHLHLNIPPEVLERMDPDQLRGLLEAVEEAEGGEEAHETEA